MTRSIQVGFGLVLFALGLASCDDGRYADLKAAYTTILTVNDQFTKAMAEAKDADQVLAALQTFSATYPSAKAAMLAIDQRYPDLKATDAQVPGSIKDLNNRLQQSRGQFTAASKKFMQYRSDKRINDAIEQLLKVL